MFSSAHSSAPGLDATPAERIVGVARVVTEYWLDRALDGGASYGLRDVADPLVCILDALYGQTDASELGISTDHPDAQRVAAAIL